MTSIESESRCKPEPGPNSRSFTIGRVLCSTRRGGPVARDLASLLFNAGYRAPKPILYRLDELLLIAPVLQELNRISVFVKRNVMAGKRLLKTLSRNKPREHALIAL